MAANPIRVTEGSQLEAVRVAGAGFPTGFADCVVFNSEARCAADIEWLGRLGRSIHSPRIPANPRLDVMRVSNRARVAGGSREKVRRSKYFTAEELSERLEQYRDTIARCVSIAKRKGKFHEEIDRREIETSLFAELAGILRNYRPDPKATLNTYVWGCLNLRINTVIARERPRFTVSVDPDYGYPDGGWTGGARVSAAGNPDDPPGSDANNPKPCSRQRTPCATEQNRTELKLSIKLAERRLEPDELRLFRLYHRRGYTQSEVSRIVGASQAWVSGVLSKAENKMRDFLSSSVIISPRRSVNRGEREKNP